MKKFILEYLKAMGVPAAQIKSIEDNWDKADYTTDIKPLIDEYTAAQREIFKNDPDLVSEFDSKIKARELSIVEREFKREFGLTAEETKGKDVNEIIKIGKSKLIVNKDKTLEELQNQVLEKDNKIKEYEEKTIPEIKGTIETERKNLKKERAIEMLADKIKPEHYRVPRETAIKLARVELNEKFNIDLSEDGELVLTDKKGLKPRSVVDPSKHMGIEEAFQGVLKTNNFLLESHPVDPKNPKVPVTPAKPGDPANPDDDNEKLYAKYPHMRKAHEHAAKLKAEDEAKKKPV